MTEHESSAELRGTASLQVTAEVEKVWSSVRLTLFGVIYTVLVTVAGVVVAMVGTDGSWLWWAIYAFVSPVLLGLALRFPRRPIGWIESLMRRAAGP